MEDGQMSGVARLREHDQTTSAKALGSYAEILESHFPRAVPEEIFISNASEVLRNHGFTPETAINLVSTCRDEICRPFVEKLDSQWSNSFNISSLGGMVRPAPVPVRLSLPSAAGAQLRTAARRWLPEARAGAAWRAAGVLRAHGVQGGDGARASCGRQGALRVLGRATHRAVARGHGRQGVPHRARARVVGVRRAARGEEGDRGRAAVHDHRPDGHGAVAAQAAGDRAPALRAGAVARGAHVRGVRVHSRGGDDDGQGRRRPDLRRVHHHRGYPSARPP